MVVAKSQRHEQSDPGNKTTIPTAPRELPEHNSVGLFVQNPDDNAKRIRDDCKSAIELDQGRPIVAKARSAFR